MRSKHFHAFKTVHIWQCAHGEGVPGKGCPMRITNRAEEAAEQGISPMLSQFEYNLLRLIADDCDLDQICEKMKISAPTALIGIQRVQRELKTRTMAGATARALRLGIIA